MKAGFTYIQCSPEPRGSLCKFFEDYIAPYLESSVEGKYCKGFCIYFFLKCQSLSTLCLGLNSCELCKQLGQTFSLKADCTAVKKRVEIKLNLLFSEFMGLICAISYFAVVESPVNHNQPYL